MTKVVADTLIIDLDNTIFDWLSVWSASFRPVYNAIIRESGYGKEKVEKDIRNVHQNRRTSEYSFLIEEVDCLAALRSKNDVRVKLKYAIEESKLQRDKALSLYPSVFETLWKIKQQGTLIVAYTESMSFYSAYRLKRFGLDGVIDTLFSPQDHELPAGVTIERMRRLPDEFYELQVTKSRHTPPGELKPNPDVLKGIVQSVRSDVNHCVYVGDSLFKDVAMARDVGVFDVHAKYGESQNRPEYELLKRVSHWTDEDIERENKIVEEGVYFEPGAILREKFSELLDHCTFEEFLSEKKIARQQKIKSAIAMWEKTVDVQQHFNDISMRIRNFAITVVGFMLAAIGYTLQENLKIEIFSLSFPAGIAFVAAGMFAWLSFYLMDRYWYHVLLKGAVKHASKIEKRFENCLSGIGLGNTISEESGKVKIFGIKMDSTGRLNGFYGLGFIVLTMIAMALFFGSPGQRESVPRNAGGAGDETAARVQQEQ